MQAILEKTESREWAIIENEGLRLFGVLHRPITINHHYPLVVILHGFASSKHGSNRCYVSLAEALAKEGIAALRFDFRGCGDSEGRLSDATFEDFISDALASFEFAAALEEIDSNRIGLFGASLGGSIAIEAAAKCQNIKALTLWAPVASGELWFHDFLKNHPDINPDIHPESMIGVYRGVQLNRQFKRQFANLFAYKTFATLPCPLLHLHGESDATISQAHQDAFKKNAPKQAQFVVYSEAQHSLGYAKAFPKIVQRIVAFFKETL